MNSNCRWFETGWVVQVNPDGTVPERKPGEKEFPKLTPGAEAMARMSLEQVEEQIRRGEV
jgi:hypothetical protein